MQTLYLNNPAFDVPVTLSDDLLSLLQSAGFLIRNSAKVEAAAPPAAPATPSVAPPPLFQTVVVLAATAEDSRDEETHEVIPLAAFPNEQTR